MKKWLLKFLKGERGVTLVELLAVMIILGVLAAIAVPSIGSIITNSKKKAYANALENVIAATQLEAENSNSGDLTGVTGVTTDSTVAGGTMYYVKSDNLVSNGYLASTPNDVDATTLTGSTAILGGEFFPTSGAPAYYVAAPTGDSKAIVTDTGASLATTMSGYGPWVPLADLTSGTATMPTP